MSNFNLKDAVSAFYPPFSGLYSGTAPLLLTWALVTMPYAGENVMLKSVHVLVALLQSNSLPLSQL